MGDGSASATTSYDTAGFLEVTARHRYALNLTSVFSWTCSSYFSNGTTTVSTTAYIQAAQSNLSIVSTFGYGDHVVDGYSEGTCAMNPALIWV